MSYSYSKFKPGGNQFRKWYLGSKKRHVKKLSFRDGIRLNWLGTIFLSVNFTYIKNFSINYRPQNFDNTLQPNTGLVPSLAPPPKSPTVPSQDISPRFNPFDKGDMFGAPKENIFAQRKFISITIVNLTFRLIDLEGKAKTIHTASNNLYILIWA